MAQRWWRRRRQEHESYKEQVVRSEDSLVDQDPSQGIKKSCKVSQGEESAAYSEVLSLPTQEVHQQEEKGKYLRSGEGDKENSDFTKYSATQTEEQYEYQEDGQNISSTSYLDLHHPSYSQRDT
ncbi:hypothetical protein E2320_014341, partial [Naja naja]